MSDTLPLLLPEGDRMTGLTIGSLFSGMGGLDRAAEQVFGARTVWVSDIDKGACKVLAHRYPHAPNLGDITRIDWATVPRVGIITGGYPCQPFSQAGRRLGQEDERHLWPYVRDAIAALRPPMAVFENVRGHLSLGFDEVVRDLHQLGYDVEWVLVKASDIGACHQRARLFILGVNRERRVRSGFDRWGRLHRHSADRWVVSSASQGQHDGQGTACPACSQETLRRQGGAGQRTDGDHAGVAHVAADGRVCDCRHQETAAPVLGEGGGCGHRAGVRCDADRLTEASEPWPLLDGRDARPGGDAEASDSGREPAWPGPRAAHAAGCEAASGLPLGLVVGAGGRPVRSGGVPGRHAGERQHDRGAPVRCAGTGSDEGPADSDLAGLQGLADQTGAASAERHRHLVAGAGRPDLTLLPTPTASDTNGAGAHGTGGADLRTAVQLLPTPRVENNENRQSEDYGGQRGNSHGLLSGAVSWGEYAAAIARHEQAWGVPAPEPTEEKPLPRPTLNRHGNPRANPGRRLSAKFVEWMMMQPPGWITDVPGVTRNEALKLCGNGVVTPQAVHALRVMLDRIGAES